MGGWFYVIGKVEYVFFYWFWWVGFVCLGFVDIDVVGGVGVGVVVFCFDFLDYVFNGIFYYGWIFCSFDFGLVFVGGYKGDFWYMLCFCFKWLVLVDLI